MPGGKVTQFYVVLTLHLQYHRFLTSTWLNFAQTSNPCLCLWDTSRKWDLQVSSIESYKRFATFAADPLLDVKEAWRDILHISLEGKQGYTFKRLRSGHGV